VDVRGLEDHIIAPPWRILLVTGQDHRYAHRLEGLMADSRKRWGCRPRFGADSCGYLLQEDGAHRKC
jgi:hypothetical protein